MDPRRPIPERPGGVSLLSRAGDSRRLRLGPTGITIYHELYKMCNVYNFRARLVLVDELHLAHGVVSFGRARSGDGRLPGGLSPMGRIPIEWPPIRTGG
jgi:hypothetical protein